MSSDPYVQKREADAVAKKEYKAEKKAAKAAYKHDKAAAKADMKMEKHDAKMERDAAVSMDPGAKPKPGEQNSLGK
jgi:hypothetical protein